MVERMGRDDMRAGDADRQLVADRLRAALEEGRLDLHEYDERVQRAYAAKTYGDLDGLLTDLPGSLAVQPPVEPMVRVAHPTREWLATVWGSWLGVVAITTAVWAVSCVAAGQMNYYWPVWVGGPWAVFLVIATVGGLAGGAPQKMVADRERKALARDHQQKRRALQREAIARGELPPNPTKEQRRRFIAEAISRGDLPPKPEK
nr:DUF1707 domain-containing protein [uncultured Actinoplanes sp.]